MREKMNNKKIAKVAVIILIVSALSLFFTQGKALAYGTWQGNESSGMPQKKVLSGNGSLLPNIKTKRTFSGDADTEFPYTSWSTDVSGTTMYGTDYNKTVRFGEYDSTQYYPYIGDGVEIRGYWGLYEKMKELAKEVANEAMTSLWKTILSGIHGAFGNTVTSVSFFRSTLD